MNTLEILTAARTLIHDPDHWCQGTYVDFRLDGDAYCLSGAIFKISAGEYDAADRSMIQLSEIAHSTVTFFNDTHTHAEVIGLLDQAIAELSG